MSRFLIIVDHALYKSRDRQYSSYHDKLYIYSYIFKLNPPADFSKIQFNLSGNQNSEETFIVLIFI